MGNKAFIVDFDVTVDLAGSLRINAKSEEEAQRIAKRIIKQCLEKEYCNIEIESENNSNDCLEVREMGNVRAVNITNTMDMEA